MIGYFPELYPDELLYSAIARYASRVRYPSHKILLRDLFGTDTVTAVIDLPTRVEALVSRLPALTELTSGALIDCHSLWPIYTPFQPQRRHQAILRKMKGNGGGAVHVQAGIPAGRVHPPQFLRFCTECAIEDRQHSGESYRHRVQSGCR